MNSHTHRISLTLLAVALTASLHGIQPTDIPMYQEGQRFATALIASLDMTIGESEKEENRELLSPMENSPLSTIIPILKTEDPTTETFNNAVVDLLHFAEGAKSILATHTPQGKDFQDLIVALSLEAIELSFNTADFSTWHNDLDALIDMRMTEYDAQFK